METKNILSLLGLESDEILGFDLICDELKKETTLHIAIKPYDGNCPFCKEKHYVVKEKVSSCINDSILASQSLSVVTYKRRYRCLECGKTFTQPLSFVQPRNRISILVKQNIINDLYQMLTVTYIANKYDVSISTVIRLLDQSPYQKCGELSDALCIDEFCFKHKGKENKYPSVLSNPFTKEIIDIIESRKSAYLDEYFSKIPTPKLSKIKYFISDMWEPYRTIRRKYFKNAIHIVDLFHIVKAFNEVITKVRTSILKQIIAEEDKKNKDYIFLKKNWKIFLMNRKELGKIKKENKVTGVTYYLIDKVDKCLNNYPLLKEVYWNRENFLIDFYRVNYYKQAENLINFSIQKFQASSLEYVNDLAKTFQNWKYEIINAATKTSYEMRLTNSISESNNNFIQTYVDLCFGLQNFERTRKRILMMSRERLRIRNEKKKEK